jgi:hypothetical protein
MPVTRELPDWLVRRLAGRGHQGREGQLAGHHPAGPASAWFAQRASLSPYSCGVAATTKSSTPCVFCGARGSLSTEHVVPKWVRKALQIREPVREFSGTSYVGAAETLAIVYHEVCARCNSGWMETLETLTRPVLGPLLLGAAPGTSRMLGPDQQAILATWAVKTSLLLALSKFRGQDHGWIPVSTLQWLYHSSHLPPPGTRVWMGGLHTSDIPASVQTACLYGADGEPAAQCTTFSVGCVVFQVFATGQQDADVSPDTEAWLAPTGPYQAALLQIAPSSAQLRWPPQAVFSAGDREALAGRLRQGLPARH